MSTRNEMLTLLNNVFQSLKLPDSDLNKPRPTRKDPVGKAAVDDAVYEAYLFALILRSLRQQGMKPLAVPSGRDYRFRRGPGKLKSTPKNFSYTSFTFNNIGYEMHNDTKVASRSEGAELEVDILILPSANAEGVRAGRCGSDGSPFYRQANLILEAKFYSKAVGVTVAKGFLGTCVSLRCPRCVDAFVTSCRMTPDAIILLSKAKQGITPYPKVSETKGHSSNVVQFGTNVVQRLQQALKT